MGWLYTVPLIADRGLGPIAAFGRSREMVSRVGWWSTFVLLLVLAVAIWVICLVLRVLVGRSGVAAPVMGVFEILIMPYIVCYMACMYLNSESRLAAPVYVSPPPGLGFATYGDRPSSPAPFVPTMSVYAAPAATPQGYAQSPPPGPSGAATEAAAWASAADPLARRPAADGPPAGPARAPGAPDPSWLSE